FTVTVAVCPTTPRRSWERPEAPQNGRRLPRTAGGSLERPEAVWNRNPPCRFHTALPDTGSPRGTRAHRPGQPPRWLTLGTIRHGVTAVTKNLLQPERGSDYGPGEESSLVLHRDPGRQDRPDHLGDDPLVLGVVAVGLVAGDVVDVGHDRQIRVAAIGSGQAQIDTDVVPAQLGDPARERP